MNPGDWENCVPENIKAFETFYNEATKENVMGSYSIYNATLNDVILTLTAGKGTTSTTYASLSYSCINPETGVSNWSSVYLTDDSSFTSRTLPKAMIGKTYIVRKISRSRECLRYYNGSGYVVFNEGETISIVNNTRLSENYAPPWPCYEVIDLEEVPTNGN